MRQLRTTSRELLHNRRGLFLAWRRPLTSLTTDHLSSGSPTPAKTISSKMPASVLVGENNKGRRLCLHLLHDGFSTALIDRGYDHYIEIDKHVIL